MKEQVFLSTADLREAFERTRASYEEEKDVTGIIEALSKAIKTLRDAGVDVHLQLSRSITEDSFPLAKKAGQLSCTFSLTMSGVLKINQSEHLLTLSTTEGADETKRDVLKLYVSDREYSSRSLHDDFRGECFDLKTDAEALQKFQHFVINKASWNAVIRDHDVCDTFDNTGVRRLNKFSLIPKPSHPSA